MKAYELGLYEKAIPNTLSIREKLKETKNAGFDYMEISIDETDEKLARLDFSSEERRELKLAMFEEGVDIKSMCLSGHRKYPFGHPDKKVQERSLEIMEKAITFARDLGIRIIQLAGYDVYYEEGSEKTRADFQKNLYRACEMAAKAGVMLGFETMETPFMDTVTKSMEYVDLVKSPYLGVYPDIGNLKNASLLYGTGVDDDLRRGCGHIFAAHLKETVPGKYREIPFGTGHTDFEQNIKVLKELGVRTFVGEFWYTGSDEWKKDLHFANAFLREKLDTVFTE